MWLRNLLLGRGRGIISSSRDHIRKPAPSVAPVDGGEAASLHPPPEGVKQEVPSKLPCAFHLPAPVADPFPTSNTLRESFSHNLSLLSKTDIGVKNTLDACVLLERCLVLTSLRLFPE